MIPKKPQELIKPTAEATGVSTDLVQDISSFYWGEVRKALVDMKAHNIYVESIGTFRVKGWKLAETEERYKTMIERYQERQNAGPVTFQRFSIMKDLQLRMERVQNLRRLIEQDEIKKQQVKNKRNESKTDMDTPETNL